MFKEITTKRKLLGKQMDVDRVGNLHCIYRQEQSLNGQNLSTANNTAVWRTESRWGKENFFVSLAGFDGSFVYI